LDHCRIKTWPLYAKNSSCLIPSLATYHLSPSVPACPKTATQDCGSVCPPLPLRLLAAPRPQSALWRGPLRRSRPKDPRAPRSPPVPTPPCRSQEIGAPADGSLSLCLLLVMDAVASRHAMPCPSRPCQPARTVHASCLIKEHISMDRGAKPGRRRAQARTATLFVRTSYCARALLLRLRLRRRRR